MTWRVVMRKVRPNWWRACSATGVGARETCSTSWCSAAVGYGSAAACTFCSGSCLTPARRCGWGPIVLSTLAYFLGTAGSNARATGLWWGGPWLKSGLLFGYVMFLLLLPKFSGRSIGVGQPRAKGVRRSGACLNQHAHRNHLLHAPGPDPHIFYTKFVLSALTGVAVSWGKQQRSEERPGWKQLAALLGGQTFWAAVACALIGWEAPKLLPWLMPVLIGMLVSIPFARPNQFDAPGRSDAQLGSVSDPGGNGAPTGIAAARRATLGSA